MSTSKFFVICIVCFILNACNAQSRGLSHLSSEFDRLGVGIALMIPSTSIDFSPIWSKNEDKLLFNSEGNWYSMDLRGAELQEGLWRGTRIAVNINDTYNRISDGRILKNLNSRSYDNTSKLILEDGFMIESKRRGLGTEVFINGEVFLTSTFDVFHSFAANKSGGFIIFVSEQNGVVLLRRKARVKEELR